MAVRTLSRFLIPFRSIKSIDNIQSIHTTPLTLNLVHRNQLYNIHFKLFSVLSCNIKLTSPNLNCYSPKRWKHDKNKKSRRIEDDDSDDDDDDVIDADTRALLANSKNTKLVDTNSSSMRIDAIIKAGTGMARNKAETALYESKLRINGERVLKKSTQIKIDDVIDVIQGPSPKNPEFLLVTRLTMLHAELNGDFYRVKILREKSLTIENYKDSWKRNSEDS